jgi:uncharacterized protein YbbC (DUF1343 family)
MTVAAWCRTALCALSLAGLTMIARPPAAAPAAEPTPAAPAAAPALSTPAPAVRPGIDALAADPVILRGKRVGLVTHQAGIAADGRQTVAVLQHLPGVRLTALFAPEHGLDGTYDAGEPVPNTIASRMPVFSLFGGVFQPTRQMMDRIDVFVVDLQDVGVRPFTYASTMALVMNAAREAGKPVIVLDRPNPQGGQIIDGPVLEPEFRSFIGPYPIPYVHGMTIGELALLFNRTFGIGADLTVIKMQGWTRRMTWTDTGIPWVNPSPGITSPETVYHYAATGPTDGTNIWNAVATESRFQAVLAPWIDGAALAELMNEHKLPGVTFSPSAIPHPRTGVIYRGVRLHITDPATFKPSATIVTILAEIHRLYPKLFVIVPPRRGPYLFDLVWGTKDLRLAILRGDRPADIIARWQPALQKFQKLREAVLLYDP